MGSWYGACVACSLHSVARRYRFDAMDRQKKPWHMASTVARSRAVAGERRNRMQQEHIETQRIPVKVYRTQERITVAAPMPGLLPEDIAVEVTSDGKLLLSGELRGALKGVKELLLDEWSIGAYRRELDLPAAVDGVRANVTYGNGVLVVALPIAARVAPARLSLAGTGLLPDHGLYLGHAGHPTRGDRGGAAKGGSSDLQTR